MWDLIVSAPVHCLSFNFKNEDFGFFSHEGKYAISALLVFTRCYILCRIFDIKIPFYLFTPTNHSHAQPQSITKIHREECPVEH